MWHIWKLADIKKCSFYSNDVIDFDEEELEQIDIVMEASNHCYQSWEFECISAPIKHPVSKKFVLCRA